MTAVVDGVGTVVEARRLNDLAPGDRIDGGRRWMPWPTVARIERDPLDWDGSARVHYTGGGESPWLRSDEWFAVVVAEAADRPHDREAGGPGPLPLCQHPRQFVNRTPPASAPAPYPAVITTYCDDCGVIVNRTDVTRSRP